ncbi:hypothetical protein KAX06_03975, partial [candidate division WOR-3 bacterium]|nr:hypothetical protein [candidate division WOR-3 bacterium]
MWHRPAGANRSCLSKRCSKAQANTEFKKIEHKVKKAEDEEARLVKIRKEQGKEAWAKTLLFEMIRFRGIKMSINNRQGEELLSYVTASLIKHTDKFIGAIKKDGWI